MRQTELAERLGVSERTITSWESGETRPAWPNLERLAEELEVSIDWLLRDEEGDTGPKLEELSDMVRVLADEMVKHDERLHELFHRMAARDIQERMEACLNKIVDKLDDIERRIA